MQIKTLTSHDVYNYGASLQAYALMTYLKQQGHEVAIINYKPEYSTRKYNYMWVNPESQWHKYRITRIIYCILKFIQRLSMQKSKQAFDKFTQEHLSLTKEYITFNELKENPPTADAYIVGSDQVWNSFYDTGKDPAFYLAFAPEYIKKISYSASFSITSIDENIKPFVKEMLQSFDYIAVREHHALEILEDLKLKGTWVLDPIFLLSIQTWKEIMIPYKKEKSYLLVYDFENNESIKSFALQLAKARGLKIYSINDTYPLLYADKNYSSAGPQEFLTLIYHCDCFISNSFHGSAFSILFHKDFYIFPRNRHNVNSRMESLLDMFEIKQRLVTQASEYEIAINTPIDFNKTEVILQKELEISKHYLQYALQK